MTKFIKTLMLSMFSFMTIADHALAESLPAGFVYLHDIDDSIEQELLLATDDNMVGVPLDGYEGNQAICTKEAAIALKKAQKTLKKRYPNYSLLVQDAYRSAQAVEHIKR
jgi:D-alanyl-D-alanine dipeptidase